MAFEGQGYHHKKSIWNTICIEPSGDFILLGLGIYTGHFDDLFKKDAIIVFDRCTTTINIWSSCTNAELLTSEIRIIDTETAKVRMVSFIHGRKVSFD